MYYAYDPANLDPTRNDPCHPRIAIPGGLKTTLDPAWRECRTVDAWVGFYDPPHALTSESALALPTLATTSDPTNTTPAVQGPSISPPAAYSTATHNPSPNPNPDPSPNPANPNPPAQTTSSSVNTHLSIPTTPVSVAITSDSSGRIIVAGQTITPAASAASAISEVLNKPSPSVLLSTDGGIYASGALIGSVDPTSALSYVAAAATSTLSVAGNIQVGGLGNGNGGGNGVYTLPFNLGSQTLTATFSRIGSKSSPTPILIFDSQTLVAGGPEITFKPLSSPTGSLTGGVEILSMEPNGNIMVLGPSVTATITPPSPSPTGTKSSTSLSNMEQEASLLASLILKGFGISAEPESSSVSTIGQLPTNGTRIGYATPSLGSGSTTNPTVSSVPTLPISGSVRSKPEVLLSIVLISFTTVAMMLW
jgi:hypothetical protein